MGMAEARVISRRSNEADLDPVRKNADWIEGIKAGGAVKKGETIWKTGNVFIETPTPAIFSVSTSWCLRVETSRAGLIVRPGSSD